MTKGLVAMLVNGLSGHTNDEIQRVQPGFITLAGIGSTLTPGRNNGFLNMMKVMKDKAQALADEMAADAGSSSSSGGGGGSTTGAVGGGPIYRSVVTKLGMLKPTELVVEDESYKHAGHAGVAGQAGGETHFNVRIVAPCFDGLSLVQVTHTYTHRTFLHGPQNARH
jgi:stress-induced morphogen